MCVSYASIRCISTLGSVSISSFLDPESSSSVRAGLPDSDATGATSVTVHADLEEFRALWEVAFKGPFQLSGHVSELSYLSLLLRPQDAAFSHLASWQVGNFSLRVFESSCPQCLWGAFVSVHRFVFCSFQTWRRLFSLRKFLHETLQENAIWCTSATCKLNQETEDQKRKQHGRMIWTNSIKKVGQVSFSSFLSAWNVDDVVHEGIVSRESLWLGSAVEAPEGRGLRNVEHWQIWSNFWRICFRFSIKKYSKQKMGFRNSYDKFL